MPRLAWILVAAALVILVVAVAGAAFVLATGSGSSSIDASIAAPVDQFELPLAGDPRAVMLARRSGRVLVGLAALPGGPVEVAAIKGEEPVPSNELTFSLDGRRAEPTPCGRACWRLDTRSPKTLVVSVPAALRFDLPRRQLLSGAGLFRRMTRTMNGLRTVRYVEELTSGVGPVQRATFEIRAPNRMRFRSAGGFRSVIIGDTRWDSRDGQWERSPFPGLRVPDYMWAGAGNARVLGRTTLRGRPVQILSVFDRRPLPAWFRLFVDPQGRVLDAEMLAPVHFMRQRFRAFNAPISIEPPR